MVDKIFFIGISGGTCSGKTFLANSLVEHFGTKLIDIIKVDSYYHDLSHLDMSEREQNNFDHPNSFDFKLLYKNLLMLQANKTINIPTYSYKTHTRKKVVKKIKPKNIILIEGIYSLYDKNINSIIDLKVFLDKPDTLRKKIRFERDVKQRARTNKSIENQYSKTVQPMYIKFINKTKNNADLIIKEDNMVNSTAFTILCKEIEEILKENANS
tara:strand:+ start:159 stop:797 length:639 start_codon:yes stop_codon:yes gene_type:complete